MSGNRGAVHPYSAERPTLIFRLLDWLTAALICAAAAAVLLFVVFSPVRIKSSSVSDCSPGDLIFADRLGKYIFGFHRGDAVVLKSGRMGDGSDRLRVARVTALSGEKVVIAEGNVYINNALLDDTAYAERLPRELRVEFTVPTDSILALPDERAELDAASIESLLIPVKDVIGELRFTAFPPSRLRFYS